MKNIKVISVGIVFWVSLTCFAKEEFVPVFSSPRVIPVFLAEGFLDATDIEPGDGMWLHVEYAVSPQHEPFFVETGEKIWWIQHKPLLILGSTGLPLPTQLTSRATAYIRVFLDGDEISGSPYAVFPQKDTIVVSSDITSLRKALAKRLSSVDATYLSTVANFLASNLSTLEVQATSYAISGVGTVIDDAGDWVGGRLNTVSGGNSVFIGQGAGTDDDGSSNGNVFVGYETGLQNISGEQNTASGHQALYSNTTGSFNTAFGYWALYANDEADFNTAVGNGALMSNTEGTENTALGNGALWANTTGEHNTASGNGALFLNTEGERNTALGHGSLASNSTGSQNTAAGAQALYSNTTGWNNTASGFNALISNTTGQGNTVSGFEALYCNTTGTNNTALGHSALFYNTEGGHNVAAGYHALMQNRGDNNVACGKNALSANNAGNDNVALGCYALVYNVTGNDNTACGQNAGPTQGSSIRTNTTALGHDAAVTASNQVRIGDDQVASIGGHADWSNVSDGRFKVDVQENVPGLDFITGLRPVTYRLDRTACRNFIDPSAEKENRGPQLSDPQSGFIAQEVEAIAKKQSFVFSGVDAPPNDRTPYSLRYAQFVVPLVKAVQELKQQLDEASERIAILEAENQSLQSVARLE